MSRKKLFLTLPLALAASLAFTACTSAADETDESAMEPSEMETTESDAMETDDMADESDPAAYLVGAGCADYAAQVPDGPGSVAGMYESTVVEAASNNPLLTTLASAVSGGLNPDVNLVDTLNGGEFTVFAPVDEAFAMLDDETIETLKTDSDLLTSILTYHVVPGQALPDDLPGMHTTVQGTDVEVTGSGDTLMVNGANVICGGVQTENATVYLIDSVLLPEN